MSDFEKAFERRFSSGGDSRVDIAYRKWLLKGSHGTPPSTPAESERIAAENWYGCCKNLMIEAKELAEANIPRGGFEFDDLKRRAMSLADECFAGSDRGIVFAYVAQAFDKVILSRGVSQDGAGGCWIKYPRIDPEKFKALREIEKFASFDESYRSTLEDCTARYIEKFGDDRDLLNAAKANGRLFRKLNDEAFTLAFKADGAKLLEERLAASHFPESQTYAFLREKIRASFKKGEMTKSRCKAAKEISKNKAGESIGENRDLTAPVATVHPNSLLNLKPSRKWTVVSDETGEAFGNNVSDAEKAVGKYVFVLIPEEANVAPLKTGWHAVDESLDSILVACDVLYKSSVGILGIPVSALYCTNRNLWHAGIETLLDITLRLLPVDGETEITLNIERRGTADSGDIALADMVLDHAMYRLSLADPGRAKQIRLKARFITKDDSPFNGYADAVAYSWGCGKDVKAAFKRYGWEGPCLIKDNGNAVGVFRRCLELIQHNNVPSCEDWSTLVSCADAKTSGSLIGAVLKMFGEDSRKNVNHWRIYLDYVLSHLDSKAIRLNVLKPQIEWLKEYEPVSIELPPRLRLLWLAAQLADSNHRGGTTFAQRYERELANLSNRLKDEDAPLVCFAALHLAVEMTDAYRFDDARVLLLPWESEPVAVPGLRYHAQVLSSLGQHAAFLGENEKALGYFDRAMMLFSRLSDEWQRDFDHTCAYAVIAAMDCASPKLNELMARYLYGEEWREETMVDMAQQFAAVGEDEPDSKYAHAILLRYLVMLPESDSIRAAYVARNADWKWSADGHPWELIAFCRALLLPDSDPMRKEWFKCAYELCLGQGPTLQVIASVIGAARLAAGDMSREEYLEKVEEVASVLPDIGAERISALRGQVENPIPPLDLAKVVLPFNFR